jgi:hypothetical protein
LIKDKIEKQDRIEKAPQIDDGFKVYTKNLI